MPSVEYTPVVRAQQGLLSVCTEESSSETAIEVDCFVSTFYYVCVHTHTRAVGNTYHVPGLSMETEATSRSWYSPSIVGFRTELWSGLCVAP